MCLCLYLPESPVRLFFCSLGTCAAVGVAAVYTIKNASWIGLRTSIWPDSVRWRYHPAGLVFMPTVYTGNTGGVRQSMPLSLLMRLLPLYRALLLVMTQMKVCCNNMDSINQRTLPPQRGVCVGVGGGSSSPFLQDLLHTHVASCFFFQPAFPQPLPPCACPQTGFSI